jgi:hypothetical protein
MFFKIGLTGIKSFVYALSQTVWLFLGIFILNGLMDRLDRPITDIVGLWTLIDLFSQYWGYFFLSIWALDFYLNFKEVSHK